MFHIDHAILMRLCKRFSFAIDESSDRAVFFGLRGLMPVFSGGQEPNFSSSLEFRKTQKVVYAGVNYYHPRCILGQWLPKKKLLAIFPGSTVPNLGWIYMRNKMKSDFNLLLAGCYTYEKGLHPKGFSQNLQYEAFRMCGEGLIKLVNYHLVAGKPYVDYGGEDVTIEVTSPRNNIHSAVNISDKSLINSLKGEPYSYEFVLSDLFRSYGCQVIVGSPRSYLKTRDQGGKWNAWDAFYQNAYHSLFKSQRFFDYVLFEMEDLLKVKGGSNKVLQGLELRFGSFGEKVIQLQKKLSRIFQTGNLNGIPFYQGGIDGYFGAQTARALIQFQKQFFGRPTGIADANTFQVIGIS